ncbi:MAG: hypothetical protein JKY65_32750 [Planctomycetes bacterium]|nr:hypothetical protein [Planctomycetota bacterium]
MFSARVCSFFAACLLLLGLSGCGIYQEFPTQYVTPWPIVAVSGDGHARPRALVTRKILDGNGGGERLDVAHDVIVESGLFSAVQTRSTQSQIRPGYDYILELSLTTTDNYEWYAWLGLIPGFPILSEETYTLSCTVYDGEQELLGQVSREGTVTQALGLVILPFNVLYSVLPGQFSSYDLLSADRREARMIRAMTRDVLMLANEKFDFRPAGLLSPEEEQDAKRKVSSNHLTKGIEAFNAGKLVEAEQAFALAIKADPTHNLAWYNLACTYSRMGKLEAAEETLGYAIKAGMRDLEHMTEDKDLDPLREREGFQALLKALKRDLEGQEEEALEDAPLEEAAPE